MDTVRETGEFRPTPQAQVEMSRVQAMRLLLEFGDSAYYAALRSKAKPSRARLSIDTIVFYLTIVVGVCRRLVGLAASAGSGLVRYGRWRAVHSSNPPPASPTPPAIGSGVFPAMSLSFLSTTKGKSS